MLARNRITVNLSDKEYAEMAKLSAEHNLSLAWLCRRAIADLLENNHQSKNLTPLSHPFPKKSTSHAEHASPRRKKRLKAH